jgi:pimeloyl-ACP methyl ester carboxylesterase
MRPGVFPPTLSSQASISHDGLQMLKRARRQNREEAMRLRITTLLTLVALLFVATACGGQAAPAPTEMPPAPLTEPTATAESAPNPTAEPTAVPTRDLMPVFEEAACPMDLPPGAVKGEDITCGYVTVPEGRASAGESMIELAVAVINSASDEPAPDPLFMLAGGPGESALTSFVQLLAVPGMERFWAKRDVVLVEQRGTRYSTPFLRCDEMSELTLDLLSQNLGDEAEEARKLEAWAACRERLEGSGVRLAAYNSVENAADIVAVADALGYRSLNL